MDASTFPEVVKVLLTKPLCCRLCVVLVCCYCLHTLIVLDIDSKLIVANQSVAKEAEFLSCLLCLVVNQFVSKVGFDGLLLILMVLTMAFCDNLMSRCNLNMLIFIVLVVRTMVATSMFFLFDKLFAKRCE